MTNVPKDNNLKKHFTASALIIKDGKVLLAHHKKLGVWLYPGGHIEKNETPDQALTREVKEETGLDVEILSNKDNDLADQKNDVSVLHLPYAHLCELVGDHYHNDLIYLCKISRDDNVFLRHNPKESEGIGFFGLEDLNDIKLFPNFKALLEKALKKPRINKL